MSDLADYQRSVMRVLFEQEPADAELRALGHGARWRMYREMVRGRLRAMAEVAFKRALRVAGPDAFGRAFSQFLAESPPRSRFIREATLAFGLHWLEHVEHGSALAASLRLDATIWELAYRKAAAPSLGEGGVRELDFEGTLVLNPVLELLRLSHPAHEAEHAESLRRTALLVYRPPGVDQVRWWEPGATLASLVERSLRGETRSLSEMVRVVAEELGVALDRAFVERLSLDMSLAIGRGVVVGVRS